MVAKLFATSTIDCVKGWKPAKLVMMSAFVPPRFAGLGNTLNAFPTFSGYV